MQQSTHKTHSTHPTHQSFIHPTPAVYRLKRRPSTSRKASGNTGSKVPVVGNLDEARRLAWEQHRVDIEMALSDLAEQGWQPQGFPGPTCIEARQFSKSVLADSFQGNGTTLLLGCALTVALSAATGGMFLLVLAGLALTQNEYVETTEFRVEMAGLASS